MKRFLLATTIAALSLPVFADHDHVSMGVGHPEYYGPVEIYDDSTPLVINSRPVLVTRAPRGTVAQRAYLRVPPGHARNWSRHCAAYDACGQQVYFVQDRWYTDNYGARYNENLSYQHDRGWYDGASYNHGWDTAEERKMHHQKGHDVRNTMRVAEYCARYAHRDDNCERDSQGWYIQARNDRYGRNYVRR